MCKKKKGAGVKSGLGVVVAVTTLRKKEQMTSRCTSQVNK